MRIQLSRVILGWAMCLLGAGSLVRAQAQQKQVDTNPPPAPRAAGAPSATDASQFVGSDTCKACHQPESDSFERSAHWKTAKGPHQGPQSEGCESCHGPGKAHVDGGGDASKIIGFKKLSPKESSARCLSCHQVDETRSNFLRSEHLKNDVGCTSCHSEHSPHVARNLLTAPQPLLCYGCHREVEPDFSKPTHHRVNEGLVGCSDCHNPHGTFQAHQLRATAAQQAVCLNCHADKAGPFQYEHPPVKVEGCPACHTPHGSANAHLINRPQVNQLCLECHTLNGDSVAPLSPTFHNQAEKYQACTLCHTAIHGSNTDVRFFRR
jgi:DmsE family decaheme c-type cytochrome